MLYREIIAVCSDIHRTLDGRKVEFLNVKSGSTHSNHWALKVLYYIPTIITNANFLNLIIANSLKMF